MILKAKERGGGAQLARYLLSMRDNDHVELHEVRGFVGDDLLGAFREVDAIAKGTRCENYLFSASLNPPGGEFVTVEDFEQAADEVERKLGLEGQPRAIVFHEKDGRRHAHVVWSRIFAIALRTEPLERMFGENVNGGAVQSKGPSRSFEHSLKPRQDSPLLGLLFLRVGTSSRGAFDLPGRLDKCVNFRVCNAPAHWLVSVHSPGTLSSPKSIRINVPRQHQIDHCCGLAENCALMLAFWWVLPESRNNRRGCGWKVAEPIHHAEVEIEDGQITTGYFLKFQSP